MLLTTTDGLEGYRIERYLGVVGGEAVEGAVGGQDKQRLHEAIQHAVNDMRRVASAAGANAVVGVVIDHEITVRDMWSARRSVVAYGTAVVVVPTREPPPVLPPPLEAR